MLACRDDWCRLPMPLRERINEAYRHRRTDPGGHRAALRDALVWFRNNRRGGA